MNLLSLFILLMFIFTRRNDSHLIVLSYTRFRTRLYVRSHTKVLISASVFGARKHHAPSYSEHCEWQTIEMKMEFVNGVSGKPMVIYCFCVYFSHKHRLSFFLLFFFARYCQLSMWQPNEKSVTITQNQKEYRHKAKRHAKKNNISSATK